MSLPTWGDLASSYCTEQRPLNPFYEDMSTRRYNYGNGDDTSSCRMIFLKGVLEEQRNKTLVRTGRFIWCKSLKYEGATPRGYRQLSFTVDNGHKRFYISEKNILCLPSKTFINNNLYFRQKGATFNAFASAFSYKGALKLMAIENKCPVEDLMERIRSDNPYKPGTLVAARQGYFYPETLTTSRATLLYGKEHPYGIIVGSSFNGGGDTGREFYRVKFGATTYERVHPVQMEIINEV